ncbi:MAG: hypothetical protein K2X81_11845 [Candidatus Obscuribacterales bacterium]|nr:hypothetical protein [Candidatus Obscuribacterales bacterium]
MSKAKNRKHAHQNVNDACVKTEYEGEMEHRLKDIGHKIDDFLNKADEKTTSTIDSIKTKKEKASTTLCEMKGASKEAWTELKQGMDRAWEELTVAFDEISSASEKAAAKFSKSS